MLSRFIVKSYRLLIEGMIWLLLIGAFASGWSARGIGGALGALLLAFLFCVAVFGTLLVLLDIRDSVKKLENRWTGDKTAPAAKRPDDAAPVMTSSLPDAEPFLPAQPASRPSREQRQPTL